MFEVGIQILQSYSVLNIISQLIFISVLFFNLNISLLLNNLNKVWSHCAAVIKK